MCGVPMDATFHGGSNDTISGRIYHRFVPICRKNRPLSSIQFIIGEQFIGGVVDTGEHFIGGVVETGDNIFPRCR